MKPSEILEKYGLKTDVKSIKQRIDNQEHFDFLYNLNERTNFKDIVIESTRLMRADLDLLCEMAERAEKVEKLLDLYHLKNNYMEDYYTFNSLRGSQKTFDNLKDVNEEINLKEKELEEMK